MTAQHWYGIALIGGAILGFFVLSSSNYENATTDALYNSGLGLGGKM